MQPYHRLKNVLNSYRLNLGLADSITYNQINQNKTAIAFSEASAVRSMFGFIVRIGPDFVSLSLNPVCGSWPDNVR